MLVWLAMKYGGPLKVMVVEVKIFFPARNVMPPVKEASLSIWPSQRGVTLQELVIEDKALNLDIVNPSNNFLICRIRIEG